MKKLNILVSLFLGALLFTACADDNDSNPTLQQPSTFVLNQPGLSGNVYDLAKSTDIVLTAKQPEYGYTALVNYGAQMSLDNTWSDTTSVTMNAVTHSPKYTLDAVELDKSIMKLANITDASQLTTDSAFTIYVRMNAALQSDSTTKVNSNVVTLKVMPYYIQLKDAAPDYWYLVGSCFGDGTWSAGSYAAHFPFSLVQDYTYNKATGQGLFTFTGYFKTTDNFKLKHSISSWKEQWGMNSGNLVLNDGGSGNINVPADGYYTLTLNTIDNTLTLLPAEAVTTTFPKVSIIGLNGDWTNDIDMTPAKNATNNHMWTTTITVTAKTEFKFRANHDWVDNWGYGSSNGAVNLYGWGKSGGSNIGVEPGTYQVYFNDVDKYFRLIPIQ